MMRIIKENMMQLDTHSSTWKMWWQGDPGSMRWDYINNHRSVSIHLVVIWRRIFTAKCLPTVYHNGHSITKFSFLPSLALYLIITFCKYICVIKYAYIMAKDIHYPSVFIFNVWYLLLTQKTVSFTAVKSSK